MIKITSILVSILIFLSVAFYLQYGNISPVEDIEGCYVAKIDEFEDKICLEKSGVFNQFYNTPEGVKKYNESEWSSFAYSNDEERFVAATLKGFVFRGEDGDIKVLASIDIQPHRNTFGKVEFAIGRDGDRGRRVYFRE